MLPDMEVFGVVVVAAPFTGVVFFLNARCLESSPLPLRPGVYSPADGIFDRPLRGLEAVRGTGETGGESKCCVLEKPPPRVV